ncbi:MAG: response regulator [Gammaproteobacteria bacterium]|nr:response regulator [Gammaproteobacteria bacterium]
MDTEKLLTPNEVAELLLVSPTTVRFWAQKGSLKALTTPGGHRRFKYEDIEEFAESRGMSLRGNPGMTRILIIDDEAEFGSFLVDFLSKYKNVEVELASYSFEAGLKFRSFKPHVVLLDIMMPGINGFQICQMMKTDRALKNIRIIGMTGYPSDENVEQMLSAGAEACLKKPIDTAELLSVLNLKSG